MLPADVVGTMIYSQKREEFVVKKGPIFANFILADEINRAPAKVQSALLEAMQERQVTIGDMTYKLEEPFLVMATQNPIEQEGTYPLPEAQVDRFMLKVVIDYPKKDEEKLIVRQNLEKIYPQSNMILQPEDILRAREVVKEVYLDENGLPWEEGSVITNPDLGKALQLIADQGADAFYKGEIGEAMVATLAKYDGVMTMDDLAGYGVHELEPVTGDYRGYTVISSPPPSSGGTHLIEILNILENFDMASMEVNSAEYVHLFAETFKLAFADRAKYMADTNFVTVPLGGLTSQAYADKRAQDIDLNVAMEQAAPDDPSPYEHTDTTHFSVADVDGNCVAITKTINYYFGSGVMVDGYGFMMNNQMDDFSTDPESVNKIEPGKKPLSSMSPTVVLKPDGSPFLVLGTPGGSRIFSGVAEVISRVIDSKMDLHTAISVPKIWNCSNKNNLQYEKPLKGYEQYALTDETIAKLTEMGHGELKTAASGAFQCIMFMDDGTLYGTADPRQDGKAVGVN